MENIQDYASLHLLEILLRENVLRLAEDEKSIVILNFGSFVIEHCERYPLNRFEIQSQKIQFQDNNGNCISIDHYQEVLKIIREASIFPLEVWDRFSEEYADHVKNLYLTFQAPKSEIKNNFLEHRVPYGHPHHPCAKTRLGFRDEEVLAYVSDFSPSIPVALAAISSELIHCETNGIHYRDWFQKTFPNISLDFMGKDFVPIFIHPWQLENKIKKDFAHLFARQKIILSTQTVPMVPSLSFRSLAPVNSTLPCYIKLPVSVLSTGGIRTVSAATTENGPKISSIILEILKKEGLNSYLKLMPELMGFHIIDKNLDNMRNFSMLVRDNPFLQEDAVVLAALLGKQISNEKPLFMSRLQAAKIKTLAQAKTYFQRYCEITLRGFLDFYLLTGIALEAHQQNCILAFKDDWPEYFIYRDLAGIRAHLPSLKAYGYDFIPFPNSDTFINDREAAAHKLLHTVYQSNLGEVIFLLAKEFQVDQHCFWAIVRDITEARFTELKSRISEAVFEQDQKCFLENPWPLKALLRMRLAESTRDNIYLKIPNPLAR